MIVHSSIKSILSSKNQQASARTKIVNALHPGIENRKFAAVQESESMQCRDDDSNNTSNQWQTVAPHLPESLARLLEQLHSIQHGGPQILSPPHPVSASSQNSRLGKPHQPTAISDRRVTSVPSPQQSLPQQNTQVRDLLGAAAQVVVPIGARPRYTPCSARMQAALLQHPREASSRLQQ